MLDDSIHFTEHKNASLTSIGNFQQTNEHLQYKKEKHCEIHGNLETDTEFRIPEDKINWPIIKCCVTSS